MKEDFRVRFAPSPTGLLHIGNARTAILNWLLARRHGGSFLLRIEDTDLERSSAESEHSILEDLRWLGLVWNEGPDVGGNYGPYRQSERGEHYRQAARRLQEGGLAYYCRLTDEEMEQFHQQSLEEGRQPVYRGQLSGPDRPDAPGEASIRFRVPDGSSAWTDLVKGVISVDHATVSDFILLRSDGRPTYNFAVVVDDIGMKISHVIRGDGHISNTPRQLMLYRALGHQPPAFAHIPMILGPDHKLLSKRHGATSLGEYRSGGYLPQALINYLSLLSWSSESGEEFLPVARLEREMDFDRLGKSAAVFDPEKLRWLNGKHLRELDDETLAKLFAGFAGEKRKLFDDRQWRELTRACREKVELLSDIGGLLENFTGEAFEIADPEDRQVLAHPEAARVLNELALRLERLPAAGVDNMQAVLAEVSAAVGVKGKMLYLPVRLALTGRRHGPELPRIMAVIGPARCARLLREALNAR